MPCEGCDKGIAKTVGGGGKLYHVDGSECRIADESASEIAAKAASGKGRGWSAAEIKLSVAYLELQQRIADLTAPLTVKEQIKHMVERFLTWRLPKDFNPDGGISFKRYINENTNHPIKNEPVGTNLFDAEQAEAMIRHMIEGMPAVPLSLKCEKCGGSGSRVTERSIRLTLDDGRPMEKYACDECNGTGRTEHLAILAAQQRYQKARVSGEVTDVVESAQDVPHLLSLLSAAEAQLRENAKAYLECDAARQMLVQEREAAEARERKLTELLAAVRAENQFQIDDIDAALAPEEPK